MAKKVKSKKKKSAPKKTKGSKKTKGTKKTKKKVVKKVAKKKAAPKKTKGTKKTKGSKKTIKKVVKKVAKKKAAPKKAVAKKPVAKKPETKKIKTVVAAGIVTPLTNGVASVNESPTTEPFKKHRTHLKAGDPAPFFEGVDQNGNRVTSLDFPGKNIVLFFYPEDDTETCTIEACNLRDEYQYLNDNNYAVIGVSPDGVDSHERFASKYSLTYPLIADTDKNIIKAYNVWGPKQLFGRIYDGLLRTTFVIGFEGTIKSVITEVDAKDHARQITSL